ncbi:MAG: ATP-binding cassette domain-containing protein [Rhodoferax sp.]
MSNRVVFEAHGLHTPAVAGRALFAWAHLALCPGLTLVLGDEGRGKTLLLRTLAAEFPQALEHATLAGHALHSATPAYRQEVAWFDPGSPAWEQTVVDAFWAAQAARYPRWSTEVLEALAQDWGLQAHRAKPFYMLSTGSRRKALMAAALASGAALTLLDMPFAALDGAAIRTLREVLADCAEHPRRAFVLADYSAPAGLQARTTLDLDTLACAPDHPR